MCLWCLAVFRSFRTSDRNSCCIQMGEIKTRHEVMKEEQEKNHSEQLNGLKQQYETSLEGNLVLRMDGYFFCTYLNLSGKIHEWLTAWQTYSVLHLQIYFWCHNIYNLFRAQQILQTPAAGSGERYEGDWSYFICKSSFTTHWGEQGNERWTHSKASMWWKPCRGRSKSWAYRTKPCLRS